jgi:glycosyltransferase involved in cell wall biosynthesis
MRILWVSDSPTSPSGFGMVTSAVCRGLAERGHSVHILGWQSRGSLTRWEGIPVYPIRYDGLGRDVLLGYLLRIQPQFVVTLADVWWMPFLADPDVQRYLDVSGARWVLYYPIDGADPEGQLPASWVRMLETADVPVTMSRFGAEVSRACGVDCAYIPHGCDVTLFAPPDDKQAAKARYGYQDRFVILSDARNQPRKLLPRLLDIVGEFSQDKPDVLVHLHTDPEDAAADTPLYTYRLRPDIEALGLDNRVRFTAGFRMWASGGLPATELAALYAAADVHLLCSWGEGFGLPSLQAAAAGVVPIAVGQTASRELVEGHGVPVPAETAMQDEFGLVRYLLSREGTVAALDRLYRDRELLTDRSRQARAFALDYGWPRVLDRWEELLRSAPPRRRPSRSRSFDWINGAPAPPAELPEPVQAAVAPAFAGLPDGARVSLEVAERRLGEVETELRRDAFREGDLISLPVRLPPFFEGAPAATVGHLLVNPADLALAGSMRDIFPGVALSVPRPPEDPSGGRFLTVEELLPALLQYALVIDYTGGAVRLLDLACAALGVPFAGHSALWPEIGPADPWLQVRRLLTDQGWSELRRQAAVAVAEQLYGGEVVARLRSMALAGRSEPQAPDAATPQAAEVEMVFVRPRAGVGPDATERIAERVARLGGLILMATAGQSLVVMLPRSAKQQLEANPLVGLLSGLTLDEERKGSKALKRIFLTNVQRQLSARTAPTNAMTTVGGLRYRATGEEPR